MNITAPTQKVLIGAAFKLWLIGLAVAISTFFLIVILALNFG